MIFLSPGHHPAKPGAVFEGFAEHDEAVRWVERIHHYLPQGHSVMVPPLVLQQKVDFINSRHVMGSFALEVHFNSAKKWNDEDHDGVVDPGEEKNVGRGCEVLYFPGSEKGMNYAQAILDAIAPFFPPSRGVKEGWYRMDPKYGVDFFLDKTRCPAIIIEPEFIQFKDDIQAHREECCEMIALALEEFCGIGR